MMSLFRVFWPHIERETRLDTMRLSVEQWQDIDLIKQTAWDKDGGEALEQARRLADQESERKKAAESKASIYLAVIAAIVPVLSSLLTDFFGESFNDYPRPFQVASILLFVLGMIYLVASGIWAFRTLAISSHTRVDAIDIAKAWGEVKPVPALIRELLISTRLNHAGANKKMDYIRLAHEFLLRTFLTFTVLFLLMVLRQPLEIAVSATAPWISKVWAAMIG
jgi:hypothetical protein